MANEISITASLTASKDGISIASGSLSMSLDMTGTDVATQTQLIGYAADELVDIASDIGAIGYLAVKSFDSDNPVTLSYDTGGSFAGFTFAVIPAGGILLIKPSFPTGKTHIYGKATTAEVLIMFWAVEE
jgi:hypothetical protein